MLTVMTRILGINSEFILSLLKICDYVIRIVKKKKKAPQINYSKSHILTMKTEPKRHFHNAVM